MTCLTKGACKGNASTELRLQQVEPSVGSNVCAEMPAPHQCSPSVAGGDFVSVAEKPNDSHHWVGSVADQVAGDRHSALRESVVEPLSPADLHAPMRQQGDMGTPHRSRVATCILHRGSRCAFPEFISSGMIRVLRGSGTPAGES